MIKEGKQHGELALTVDHADLLGLHLVPLMGAAWCPVPVKGAWELISTKGSIRRYYHSQADDQALVHWAGGATEQPKRGSLNGTLYLNLPEQHGLPDGYYRLEVVSYRGTNRDRRCLVS